MFRNKLWLIPAVIAAILIVIAQQFPAWMPWIAFGLMDTSLRAVDGHKRRQRDSEDSTVTREPVFIETADGATLEVLDADDAGYQHRAL